MATLCTFCIGRRFQCCVELYSKDRLCCCELRLGINIKLTLIECHARLHAYKIRHDFAPFTQTNYDCLSYLQKNVLVDDLIVVVRIILWGHLSNRLCRCLSVRNAIIEQSLKSIKRILYFNNWLWMFNTISTAAWFNYRSSITIAFQCVHLHGAISRRIIRLGTPKSNAPKLTIIPF